MAERSTPLEVFIPVSVFVALQGWLLYKRQQNKRQQTIGKLAMGIRIERVDGAEADIARILLLRELPKYAFDLLLYALLVYVLDVMFFFDVIVAACTIGWLVRAWSLRKLWGKVRPSWVELADLESS